MIPKIIHYCWLSNDPVPEDLQEHMASWRIFLPDYEFKKWDFTVFDKASSAWVSEAFDNKKYAFAADYIRLFAVYNYGGIYLDMDIQVVKKFDDLLGRKYMFAYENKEKTGIEAGCFGAEKDNLFIKKCLEYYENKHFIKQDGSFDTLPLPRIMKKILEENNFDYTLFNQNYFTAKSFETGKIKVTDETYCIHNFAGSWLDDIEKTANKYRETLAKYMPVRMANRIARFSAICKSKGIKTAVSDTMKWFKEKVFKR